MAAFTFADVTFPLKVAEHMFRTSGPDVSKATIRRFFTPKNGNKERIQSIVGAISVDPYVLQKVVHSIDGDYTSLNDGKTFIPRDFDLWVKCATQLGHRGYDVPILFNRWFQGSALNTQPRKYDGAGCPFGIWETYKVQEPHFMSRGKYGLQVPEMERIIDEYLESFVGKTEEVGKVLRLLIWDLYCYTSYGVEPSVETARMLKLFEDHSPEFDYAVRMCVAGIPYEWSPSLKYQIETIGDWCWKVTQDRIANIDKYRDSTDVLTDIILNHTDIDIKKSEGALRGVFTGGMNNCHGAVCGALIHNSNSRDSVYRYLIEDPETNIEHILREALRLYTSIPTSRYVREEDEFYVDGKKLEAGTSVILSTYAINTDSRSWNNAMEFDASRFKDTTELGFMCQKGFAPLGAAAELGGRQCGARYHDAHMMRTILSKLLRDYKFVARPGGYFDFKQNAGTSMYAGKCFVTVQRRK